MKMKANRSLRRTHGRFRPALLWLALIAPIACLGQFFPRQGGVRSRTGAGFQVQPREYRSHTTLGSALVEVDQDTHSLIVVADEDTNEQIKKIIQDLDTPRPQVLLEVLFLEVTLHDDLDLGVEGSLIYRHDSLEGTAGSDFNVSSILQGGFHQVMADDWSVTLRALAEKGSLKVLSRPSILAVNNQEAVMMVGQEVPFVTNSRVTENGQTINTIQYSEIGIILRVTPFITSDNLVQMIVSPEISTLTDQSVPISETVSSPVIAKRAAETVVVTPDGKTVVIGGLIDSNKTESVQKIPILGDIPLLGAAFRRKITKDSRSELLIFLTPYIIDTPDKLVAATKEKVGRTALAPSAVPDSDLQGFLDSLEPAAPQPASQLNMDNIP